MTTAAGWVCGGIRGGKRVHLGNVRRVIRGSDVRVALRRHILGPSESGRARSLGTAPCVRAEHAAKSLPSSFAASSYPRPARSGKPLCLAWLFAPICTPPPRRCIGYLTYRLTCTSRLRECSAVMNLALRRRRLDPRSVGLILTRPPFQAHSAPQCGQIKRQSTVTFSSICFSRARHTCRPYAPSAFRPGCSVVLAARKRYSRRLPERRASSTASAAWRSPVEALRSPL